MDEVIKRDQNFKTVGAAVTYNDSQDITMLRVDPTTKYLLVDIAPDSGSAATASPIASRDQNFRPVCLGWDETNQTTQEILTDENGFLLCDVLIT